MINQNAKQAEFFGTRIEEILLEIYQETKNKSLIENVR
jgi:hypothetical protein